MTPPRDTLPDAVTEADPSLAFVRDLIVAAHPTRHDRIELAKIAIETACDALRAGDLTAAGVFVGEALLHLRGAEGRP